MDLDVLPISANGEFYNADVNVEEIVVESDVANEKYNIFDNLSLVELSRSSWYPAYRQKDNFNDRQTYLRGCKWSPDGTCCLTVVNNGGVHALELPRELYEGPSVNEDRPIDILDSAVHVPESGVIYDFCWYTGMNSLVPESCCWLTTRQHAPIQMWDAFDGVLRCSYRGYNAYDEVEAALSICFSADGNQIHAGYKKCLLTFDTNRPGREYVTQSINSSAASLAVSPCHDGLIAIGSWRCGISLYDIFEGRTKSLGKMNYHTGGVTHLKFLPDGTKLVSGARKDSKLLVWDLRYNKSPLKVLYRKVDTNQRIYFDISSCGNYLVSGGTDGIVNVWNLSEEISMEGSERSYKQSSYPLHSDCCNGVSIHPCRPIIATSSGQHHIYDDTNCYSGDTNDSNSTDNHDNSDGVTSEFIGLEYVYDRKLTEEGKLDIDFARNACGRKNIENSLQFWWTGKTIINRVDI